MARGPRSLQERIRKHQRGSFVGRQGQVIQFRENLQLPVDDELRRFLFNIHGDAGVGKTFLTRQLQQTAVETGALTAYMDETAEDVASAMSALANDFSRAGVRLAEFEKHAEEYRQRRRELESDPQTPDGVATFLTKTAVTVGLAVARDVPMAGSLLAPLDPAVTADQVNRVREYLARKFADHRVMRLLLSPAEELTPVFVKGLNRVAADSSVALFLDTYERTGLFLDHWLHELYTGRYGDLPETLVTVVSGQKPLSPNRWSDFLSVIADIPLEPFSVTEARQFLASKNITDEAAIQVIINLSGRLPLWLATLADARPDDSSEIGDPTGDAVERFLKWETDPERRDTAVAAALPRVLNQDIVDVIAPGGKAPRLFTWLRELPFVSPRGDSWAYHDVVRAPMLRMRRAEGPARWRAQHILLAQANAHWAAESAGEISSATWSNPAWVDYTREETYHLLCADPGGSLPRAFGLAVRAAVHSTNRARQWAALFTDAGADAHDDQLQEWGQRLTDGIRDGQIVGYLTCLIDDALLSQDVLATALEERGDRHRAAGRIEDALADFTRVIELTPDQVSAARKRGLICRTLQRHEDALADFTRAIELNPNEGWAIAERGETFRLLERYEEALADLSRAIELNPKYARAIACRGQVYQAMERYGDAVVDLSRAIELSPGKAWIIVSRGRVYQAMERYDDAAADFTRAAGLNLGEKARNNSSAEASGLQPNCGIRPQVWKQEDKGPANGVQAPAAIPDWKQD